MNPPGVETNLPGQPTPPLGSPRAGEAAHSCPTVTLVTPKTPAAEATQTGVRGSTAFATTHWSLVVRAAETGTAEGEAALEELCRTYWTPLYEFARRRGSTPLDAEDLTQGFFADLLARGAVARADAARGRFRTFLLTAFQNFAAHERDRSGRLKRGGGRTILSIQAIEEAEGQLREEPASTETPETLFDRKWAANLVDQAMAAVAREYVALGKSALFEELKAALWGGHGEVPYDEVAARLGSTEGALRVAVHRLRHRLGDKIRAEVAKTVLGPDEIEDEVRHLLAVLSR